MFTTSFEETCASGTARLLHCSPAAARTDHASASRCIESGGGDNVLAAAGVHGCYRMLVCRTAHVPKVIRPNGLRHSHIARIRLRTAIEVARPTTRRVPCRGPPVKQLHGRLPRTQRSMSADSAMGYFPVLAGVVDVAMICHVPPLRD